MIYEPVIGLEVHAELSTKTKIYCGCTTAFGGQPNTQVCPICLGLPGTLPRLNKRAVEYGIKAGLALNCTITQLGRMDRKNYFYPDCPKGYQITQDEFPLCRDGYIDIGVEPGKNKRIRIERIHIEEDAGKLIHTQAGTLVDYNRAGVPLIEIVSRPDMETPEEATLYLQKLKSILSCIEVSDCKMEEGSFRCDGNISISKKGSKKLGIKVEIKNMNSFKALEKALHYEYKRQVAAVEKEEKIFMETRRWDDVKGITTVMRSKEEATDYRYFPEGDLVTLNIPESWIEEIRASLPEFTNDKIERFIKQYGISKYDAGVLTLSKEMADFFEMVAQKSKEPKIAANLLMGDISRLMKESLTNIEGVRFTPEHLVQFIELMNAGIISNTIGKKVVEEMFQDGKMPKVIVEERGWIQNNDKEAILEIVRGVLKDHTANVEAYKQGKNSLLPFFVGQIMKATKGKANPQIVNQLILEEINK